MAVKLTGAVEGKEQTFVYDASFPKENAANDFLGQLWARRKIAYLLDQIRLHGETKELEDEVVRLSKEYGIATPYTSYLVLENEEAYRRHGIVRGRALGDVVADVETRLAGVQLPLGYRAELMGEWAERQSAQQRLMLLAIVAVIDSPHTLRDNIVVKVQSFSTQYRC